MVIANSYTVLRTNGIESFVNLARVRGKNREACVLLATILTLFGLVSASSDRYNPLEAEKSLPAAG
jgi:hypothetical protein